jgi:hypothetical protein
VRWGGRIPLCLATYVSCCSVIAGIDPAIHRLEKIPAKKMNARVKPAHDNHGLYERSEATQQS